MLLFFIRHFLFILLAFFVYIVHTFFYLISSLLVNLALGISVWFYPCIFVSFDSLLYRRSWNKDWGKYFDHGFISDIFALNMQKRDMVKLPHPNQWVNLIETGASCPRGGQSYLCLCNLDSWGPIDLTERTCLSLGRPDTRVLCQLNQSSTI